MSLSRVNPFNYAQFCQETVDFADWMTDCVQRKGINGYTGWLAHFQRYQFTTKELSWEDGVKRRCDLHNKLVSSIGNNRALISVANYIVVNWGGINKHYQHKDALPLSVALKRLSNEESNPTLFAKSIDALFNFTPAPRIPSHSKIYEIFEPDKWTIYDSRVSIALACLVHQYWKQKGMEVKSEYLRFPIAIGRGDRHPHPQNFPGVTTPNQCALAFIYASWLLRRIAEILRSDSRQYGIPPTVGRNDIQPLQGNWQVYHVEMALWMIGEKEF